MDMTEQPFDRDEAIDAFNRIIDDFFGTTDEGSEENKWLQDADDWFRESYNQFRSDLDEMIEAIPEAVGSDLEDLDFQESAILDVWVDGRHYELSITRLPDEPFALLPPPAPTPVETEEVDADYHFPHDFVEDWI